MPGGCRCCFLPLWTSSAPPNDPQACRCLEVGDCGVNEKLYGITLESTFRFTSLESQIVSLSFRIFSNMALSLFSSSPLPSSTTPFTLPVQGLRFTCSTNPLFPYLYWTDKFTDFRITSFAQRFLSQFFVIAASVYFDLM